MRLERSKNARRNSSWGIANNSCVIRIILEEYDKALGKYWNLPLEQEGKS